MKDQPVTQFHWKTKFYLNCAPTVETFFRRFFLDVILHLVHFFHLTVKKRIMTVLLSSNVFFSFWFEFHIDWVNIAIKTMCSAFFNRLFTVLVYTA